MVLLEGWVGLRFSYFVFLVVESIKIYSVRGMVILVGRGRIWDRKFF